MAFLDIIFTFIAITLGFNWWRTRSSIRVDLIPNCMITRHKVVFVSGPSSPFYFSNYWNCIPDFLREHGYVVEEWQITDRNPIQRTQKIEIALSRRKHENFHLIIDHPEFYSAISDLMLRAPNIASVSVAAAHSDHPVFALKPLRIYNIALESSDNWLSAKYILARFFYEIHRLWLKQAFSISNQLAFPGEKNLAIYCQYLKHLVFLAERDYFPELDRVSDTAGGKNSSRPDLRDSEFSRQIQL